MKNVLVLGSGAREVAIVRSISQSLIENSIFCISKDINPQISRLCKDYFVSDVEAVSSIVAYSKEKEIDMPVNRFIDIDLSYLDIQEKQLKLV